MSCHDADPQSHTSCLHGKRLCQQLDVNRRCIPSVTAAMKKERNETSSVKDTQLISTPINKSQTHLSKHKTTLRLRFKLPNNVISFPTDAVYHGQTENASIDDKDNIVGKLLIHPHTDLLCIVHRILTFNNKTLARLYYCTRNTQPTTYIIPPLLSLATTLRLTQFHEDHYQLIYNEPILSPYMSSNIYSGQEEYSTSSHSSYHSLNTRLINEYFTGNSAIGYAFGVKTDSINTTAPKTYRQAMKSADSAQWQEAIDAELQSMHTNNVWTPHILPPGRKLVTTKWVFRPKHDIHGKIIKYKARLVARGFEQIYGKDFDET